jgi:large subunit ribosomal protein L10
VLTREQKEHQVAELTEKFGRATCVYLADYRGIDVKAANQLRGRIRGEGQGEFEYRVAKNTVLRRASVDTTAAGIAECFSGPTAVAISFGDPVSLARILVDFAKDHEAFELKGGLLEGQPIDEAQIAALATLPSLEVLRARIVGLVQAPATKLARLLSEPGAQLARALAARGEQGEG